MPDPLLFRPSSRPTAFIDYRLKVVTEIIVVYEIALLVGHARAFDELGLLDDLCVLANFNKGFLFFGIKLSIFDPFMELLAHIRIPSRCGCCNCSPEAPISGVSTLET